MHPQTATEKLGKHLENINPNLHPEVKVIVSTSKTHVKPLNPFVLIFHQVFREIILKFDLGGFDVVLISLLADKMQFGNQVAITQTALAKELGVKRQAVTRSFKKLKDCGLLLEDEFGNQFLNAQVIAKGDLWEHKNNEEIYQMCLSAMKDRDLPKNY
ncbi:hypothetical protein GVX76_11090 [[Haemophilus] felis]|nr:hypothetical protein [[Haemophilus] felis]